MAETICLILFLVLAMAFVWDNETVHACGAVFCLAFAGLVIAGAVAGRSKR
jgi:hypothetical protein